MTGNTISPSMSMALEFGKFLPVVGTPLCVLSGLSKLGKGDLLGAGLDFVGAIPGLGTVFKGLGAVGKALKLSETTVKAISAFTVSTKVATAAKAASTALTVMQPMQPYRPNTVALGPQGPRLY